jgi:Uma2 family endonuclease
MNIAEVRQPGRRTPTQQAIPVASRSRRRWTVGEYHRMGEVGVLSKDDRVELIEGDVVEMAPIGSPHAGKVNRLGTLLSHQLFGKAIVATQNPVVLSEHNEPQPDIAVLRWRDDYYERTHPGPADVLLVIEVGDATVDDDRLVKVPLYAHYGIPELWLLDLPKQRLAVYREPHDDPYRQLAVYRDGTVAPRAFPDAVIDLAALFPVSDKGLD